MGNCIVFCHKKIFRNLSSLNLGSTQVTNGHFLQMIRSTTSLVRLDISHCPNIDQIAIFQARETFHELQHIAISGNSQFTILAVACLCSCPKITTVEAHGLQLSADDLLFLWKSFEYVTRGEIELETGDGANPLQIINMFERELFE